MDDNGSHYLVTREKNNQGEHEPEMDAEQVVAGHGNATLPNDPIDLRNGLHLF